MAYPLITNGKTDWRKVDAARALASTFGAEYDALGLDAVTALILDCVTDEGVEDYAQYRRNIGIGNLASYANVQRGRFGI